MSDPETQALSSCCCATRNGEAVLHLNAGCEMVCFGDVKNREGEKVAFALSLERQIAQKLVRVLPAALRHRASPHTRLIFQFRAFATSGCLLPACSMLWRERLRSGNEESN
jgi:hypothetical protein